MNSSSLTTTMARQPTTLITSLLKLQDPWPDPLESIDVTIPASVIRERTTLAEHYFWAIKGPALAAYSSIQDKIKDCLSCRDDLFEGETESALPSSIDCYMVGRKMKKARPCITVSCQSKIYCHKVINVIKESDWWICFYKEFPGFKFIHLRNRPRPIRMANLGDGGVFAYTSQDCHYCCAMPLFFFRSESPQYNTTRRPDSTLGGIVYLDGRPYGLTVAHALRRDPPAVIANSNADDNWDAGSTFSFMDDSEDEYESHSDRSHCSPNDSSPSGSPSINDRSEQQPLCGIPATTTEVQAVVPFPFHLTLVGKVVLTSDGSASDELDWALIELDREWKEYHGIDDPVMDINSTATPRHRDHYQRMVALNIVPEFPLLDRAKAVYTFHWPNHPVKGLLKTNQTLICIKGAQKLLSLYSITLDDYMGVGDCGVWIIDDDDNWYGHVVAGDPMSKVAYVASGCKIQRAIELSTGKKMTVARGVLSPARQTQPSTSMLESHVAVGKVHLRQGASSSGSLQHSDATHNLDKETPRHLASSDEFLSRENTMRDSGHATPNEDIFEPKRMLANTPHLPVLDTHEDSILKSSQGGSGILEPQKLPQTSGNTQSDRNAAVAVSSSPNAKVAALQHKNKEEWCLPPRPYACPFPGCYKRLSRLDEMMAHEDKHHNSNWPAVQKTDELAPTQALPGVRDVGKTPPKVVSAEEVPSRAVEPSTKSSHQEGHELRADALLIPEKAVQSSEYLTPSSLSSSPPRFPFFLRISHRRERPESTTAHRPSAQQQAQEPDVTSYSRDNLAPFSWTPHDPMPYTPFVSPDIPQELHKDGSECEGCRRRKIRCDSVRTGRWPCSACVRLKLQCIPTTRELDKRSEDPALGHDVREAKIDPALRQRVAVADHGLLRPRYYPPSSYRTPAPIETSDRLLARESISYPPDTTTTQVASSAARDGPVPTMPAIFSTEATTTQGVSSAARDVPVPSTPVIYPVGVLATRPAAHRTTLEQKAAEAEAYQQAYAGTASNLTVETLRKLNARTMDGASTSSRHSSSSRSETLSRSSYQSSSRYSSTTATSIQSSGSTKPNISLPGGLTMSIPQDYLNNEQRPFTISIGDFDFSVGSDAVPRLSGHLPGQTPTTPQTLPYMIPVTPLTVPAYHGPLPTPRLSVERTRGLLPTSYYQYEREGLYDIKEIQDTPPAYFPTKSSDNYQRPKTTLASPGHGGLNVDDTSELTSASSQAVPRLETDSHLTPSPKRGEGGEEQRERDRQPTPPLLSNDSPSLRNISVTRTKSEEAETIRKIGSKKEDADATARTTIDEKRVVSE